LTVPVRTHYDVLQVAPDATDEAIRAAYRRLAREHHPDRAVVTSAAGGWRDMPAVNEAYRVLNDPGRRAQYDTSLRRPVGPSSRSSPSVDDSAGSWDASRLPAHHHDGPARVPWRMLLFSGSIAIAGIVTIAQFTEPGEAPGPDGLLRPGDCVEILPNTDASEVACTGVDDIVMRVLIPFDGNCPGLTEPHRDRQGMGVACLDVPAGG
jgi:molecular chaperone DnaJ